MSDHQDSHGHSAHAHKPHPSHLEHKDKGPTEIGCMVVTCSDTRDQETDTSGQLIQQLLDQRHHRLAAYHIIKDEPTEIQRLLKEAAGNDAIEV
ncbi:MAG: MogA/MoaB family molybdenum cofactor biosynthesis protein, partial [Nitrospirales bacterium]